MRFIIAVTLLVFASTLSAQHTNKPFKFPGKLKEMKDMVFVPAGTFTMGRHSEFTPVKKDSNLFCSHIPMRVICMPFYISNHEVTNKEYRQFVNWVQDSIKKKNGGINVTPENTVYEFNDDKRVKQVLNVFPDTTRWMSEFPYHYIDPMSIYYHKHVSYDDYPVVGISYNMAVAYCHWRTQQINSQMPKNTTVTIRLPTEAEWEYAALYRTPSKNIKDDIEDIYLYPWNNFSLQDDKGKYKANFGNIVDANGLMLKTYMDDNATYTAMAKSFVMSDLGLYNMSGNVAEWVGRIPEMQMFTDSLGNKVEITYKDNLNSAVNKLKKVIYQYKFDQERMESTALDYMHDAELLHRIHSPRTVKGGSWADGVIYIQPGSKEVQNENYTSCRIGFRIAMDVYVYDEKDGL